MDKADIANTINQTDFGLGFKKKASEYDGFAIKVNITKYIEKYKMNPPKLIRKPPKKFYKVQEQFFKRGFLEMKDVLQRRAKDHITMKKLEEGQVEAEETDIGPITLFTVHGNKISSFTDITEDMKVMVISLDGTFNGLSNSLRSRDNVKTRILNEKKTRHVFKKLQKDFTKNLNNLRNKSDNIRHKESMIH